MPLAVAVIASACLAVVVVRPDGSAQRSARGAPPTHLTETARSQEPSAGPADRPEGAQRFCGPTETSPTGDNCRITSDLAGPPSSVAERPDPFTAAQPVDLGRPTVVDAPDPFVLVEDSRYFLFTTSAGFLNVPVASFSALQITDRNDGSAGLDFVPTPPWPTVLRTEAMPSYPGWAAPTGIWAPTVARFGERFVMFFAAKRPNPPDPANAECIGRAFSTLPQGPYAPEPAPFTCGVGEVHGALDPEVFRDTSGRPYLLAAFGGTTTMLWSLPLSAEGGRSGPARPLLRIQQPWETWFLENPSMVANGKEYVLAYSAGDWKLPTYSTGVAHCRSPVGPCVSSRKGPWVSSASGVSGPGGLSFFRDVTGQLLAVHHGYVRGREATYGARDTYLHRVRLTADVISLR